MSSSACPSPPPPRSARKLQLTQYQGAHLADGGAEAALQDPLQGLQLLRGQLSATLQPLQQLHSPRHVCRKRQGPREHTPAARRATEVRLKTIHAPGGSPGPQPRARCWWGAPPQTLPRPQTAGRAPPTLTRSAPPTPHNYKVCGGPTEPRARTGPSERLPRSSPSGSTSAAISPLMQATRPGASEGVQCEAPPTRCGRGGGAARSPAHSATNSFGGPALTLTGGGAAQGPARSRTPETFFLWEPCSYNTTHHGSVLVPILLLRWCVCLALYSMPEFLWHFPYSMSVLFWYFPLLFSLSFFLF